VHAIAASATPQVYDRALLMRGRRGRNATSILHSRLHCFISYSCVLSPDLASNGPGNSPQGTLRSISNVSAISVDDMLPHSFSFRTEQDESNALAYRFPTFGFHHCGGPQLYLSHIAGNTRNKLPKREPEAKLGCSYSKHRLSASPSTSSLDSAHTDSKIQRYT
jgi:hypothetical protein